MREYHEAPTERSTPLPPLSGNLKVLTERLTTIHPDSCTYKSMQKTLTRFFPPPETPSVATRTGVVTTARPSPTGSHLSMSGKSDAESVTSSYNACADSSAALLHATLVESTHARARTPSLQPTPLLRCPVLEARDSGVEFGPPASVRARLDALSTPNAARFRKKYEHPAPETYDLHKRTLVMEDTLKHLAELAQPPKRKMNASMTPRAVKRSPTRLPAQLSAQSSARGASSRGSPGKPGAKGKAKGKGEESGSGAGAETERVKPS